MTRRRDQLPDGASIVTDSVAALFLSKLLPLFIMPLGLALLLVLLGVGLALLRRPRSSALSVAASGALLWVCGTPMFSDWALASLERQHPPLAVQLTPSADVAVVLGGAVGQPVPPRVTLDLSSSSDRILHAARLYRAGKVRRVLVTGGNIPWLPGARPEAEIIRELLIEWGVPAAAIEVAGASRNTYENAEEIRAIRARVPFASALLVTSASHMPRALAVFRKAGLPVSPSTTDVEVVDGGAPTILRWLPDAGALDRTTRALREWIGGVSRDVV